MKTIGLASDHAGYELKEYVKTWLEAKGWEYKDFGTYSTDSCDYPDFAHQLAVAVEAGECYPGIAICGSGEGISMTLNKHQGIRAALVWIPEIAHMTVCTTMPTYWLCRDDTSIRKQPPKLWKNSSTPSLKEAVTRKESTKYL